mmetsp:Transcript_33586/g.96342  ORF Transcript_33586/g.96342 Transcript_33586/m.96342 type:complete len:387 (-) Transcript_33586:22-1182(-)
MRVILKLHVETAAWTGRPMPPPSKPPQSVRRRRAPELSTASLTNSLGELPGKLLDLGPRVCCPRIRASLPKVIMRRNSPSGSTVSSSISRVTSGDTAASGDLVESDVASEGTLATLWESGSRRSRLTDRLRTTRSGLILTTTGSERILVIVMSPNCERILIIGMSPQVLLLARRSLMLLCTDREFDADLARSRPASGRKSSVCPVVWHPIFSSARQAMSGCFLDFMMFSVVSTAAAQKRRGIGDRASREAVRNASLVLRPRAGGDPKTPSTEATFEASGTKRRRLGAASSVGSRLGGDTSRNGKESRPASFDTDASEANGDSLCNFGSVASSSPDLILVIGGRRPVDCVGVQASRSLPTKPPAGRREPDNCPVDSMQPAMGNGQLC